HRHRRARNRVVALAPLLEPRFQIGIGKAAEARNIAHAFRIRTMTGIARDNIGVRNSLHIDGVARGCEAAVAVVRWPWRKGCEIGGELMRGVWSEGGHRAPHVLL